MSNDEPHDEDATPLQRAFREHMRAHGQSETRALLVEVSGVGALPDVPRAKEAAVLKALQNGVTKRATPKAQATTPKIDEAEIYRRWNAAKRPNA